MKRIDYRVNISVEPYGEDDELRETYNTFTFEIADKIAKELYHTQGFIGQLLWKEREK